MAIDEQKMEAAVGEGMSGPMYLGAAYFDVSFQRLDHY